jgi:septal ring factor EnvC (AmiA/AmiB activator)
MNMATKTQWSRALSQIAKRQEAVGKERDKLDDLISDLQSLKEDCEEAHDALQAARDALSRLV